MGHQLELKRTSGWGGRRNGAGRRAAGGKKRVSHAKRPRHVGRYPVHVTMRAGEGLPSFRYPKISSALRDALKAANQRDNFGFVHFSIQKNHIHMLVEAQDQVALSRGMNGLASRCAKAINKAVGREGEVWSDRYHAQELKNPTMVRRAILYIIANIKKHAPQGAPAIDPHSSAPWFTGYLESIPPAGTASPARAPRTWLAREGWLRGGGRISIHESPAPAPQPRPGRG